MEKDHRGFWATSLGPPGHLSVQASWPFGAESFLGAVGPARAAQQTVAPASGSGPEEPGLPVLAEACFPLLASDLLFAFACGLVICKGLSRSFFLWQMSRQGM